MYNYTFDYEAHIELQEVALKYKRDSDEAAFKFEECFFNWVDHLRENPTLYAVYVKPDVRRVKIPDYPYYILYRTLKDTVEILAIGHTNRKENYWLERSN